MRAGDRFPSSPVPSYDTYSSSDMSSFTSRKSGMSPAQKERLKRAWADASFQQMFLEWDTKRRAGLSLSSSSTNTTTTHTNTNNNHDDDDDNDDAGWESMSVRTPRASSNPPPSLPINHEDAQDNMYDSDGVYRDDPSVTGFRLADHDHRHVWDVASNVDCDAELTVDGGLSLSLSLSFFLLTRSFFFKRFAWG